MVLVKIIMVENAQFEFKIDMNYKKGNGIIDECWCEKKVYL